MKRITFTELLRILDDAEAIKFDGTLVYPYIDSSNSMYHQFEVTIDDETIIIDDDYVTDLHINDDGNIKFTMNGETYTISVLIIKKLG
jgi:ribonuclease PH